MTNLADMAGIDLLSPWLRRRVAALRCTTRARIFAMSVEVVAVPQLGEEPSVSTWTGERGTDLDRGLRVDLLCRLMSSQPRRLAVVVVRSGHHTARSDDDDAWATASAEAAGIAVQELVAVVLVSRWGWLDLVSGDRRDWRRLRIRSGR